MDTAEFDQEVIDHAAAVFLRYFSAQHDISVSTPSLLLARDRELLRLHWALAKPVSDLANHVLEHRHEIQSVLESVRRVEDGILRGRLDAISTLKARQMSGLSTLVVSHEPVRSYGSGPNQLLGWVLKEAWSLAARFSSVVLDSPGYQTRIEQARQRLDRCRRLQSVSQIAGETVLNRRPTAAAVTEASRSRRELYRLAVKAYRHLVVIESGDPNVLAALLRETLLGPLEPWRRYELAIGLSAAEALAAAQKVDVDLNLMVGDTRRTLARCGRFVVYWQSTTEHYTAPPSEPSEIVERRILSAYGLAFGGDRPDLVVVDEVDRTVVSIIEVKYLTGEDATDRVKAAIGQLVRYARGYRALDQVDPLLGNSLAVMSRGIDGLVRDSDQTGVPLVVDFASIRQPSFARWAAALYGG